MGTAIAAFSGMDSDEKLDKLEFLEGSIAGDPGSWSLDERKLAGFTVLDQPTKEAISENIATQNKNAQTFPEAVTAPVTSDKSSDQIKSTAGTIVKDLNILNAIAADVEKIQKGGKAQIHAFYWHAELDEDATLALIHLLETEMVDIGLVTAALGTLLPVLAAIGGFISVIGTALGEDIKGGDQNGTGVKITGLGHILPIVKAMPPEK